MPHFQYNTIDSDGKTIAGHIEAADVEAAVTLLGEQGIVVDRPDLEEIRSPIVAERAIVDVAEQLGAIADAGLPLAAAVRAMAAEAHGRRLRGQLDQLASRIEAGESLGDALAAAGAAIPAHLRALILAGIRTGQLPETLEYYVSIQRERSELKWRLLLGVIYPAILMAAVVALLLFLSTVVIPEFRVLFEEFEANLPTLTRLLLRLAEVVLPLSIAGAAGLCLVPFCRFLSPPDWLQRLMYYVPFLGPMWRWHGLGEFAAMMELMLRQRIPLPEALRLTADSLQAQSLAKACRIAADRAEEGSDGADCFRHTWQFPPSLVPMVRWSLQTPNPGEGFGTAARLYRRREISNIGLWEAIVPPVVLFVLAVAVGIVVLALFLPMISLIQNLTGG